MKRFCILLLFCISHSCGDVSPWGNIPHSDYRDLTAKHQKKLMKNPPASTRASSTIKIGLIADPQVHPGELFDVIDYLDRIDDLSFYIILGDLTDKSLKQEFEWVAEAIEKSQRPVFTVVGNHDGLLSGDLLYKEMFGKLNYSFVYGDIKFIMWNNNPFEWGYPDFNWLQSQVEGDRKVIISSHQPPGAMERFEGVNSKLDKILEHENVLASFHGHMHKFNIRKSFLNPAFTIARVKGGYYGVATLSNEKVEIEGCQGGKCSPLE
jgi:3',5'-cyclic-AMP phosphodiesterase